MNSLKEAIASVVNRVWPRDEAKLEDIKESEQRILKRKYEEPVVDEEISDDEDNAPQEAAKELIVQCRLLTPSDIENIQNQVKSK